MKYLKYKHQSIFPMWGRVKLNFRDRYEKPNIYSKNSSHCQVFFFTGLSKNDFGIILQTLTHPLIHVIDCKLCKLGNGDTPCDAPITLDAPSSWGAHLVDMRPCGCFIYLLKEVFGKLISQLFISLSWWHWI